MAVQIILKNSAVEGKNPTAAQLAQGEIALNFHESGPYLTCEDSAGNVKRIAGVQQGTSAPANALDGAFWWNTGTDTLFIFAEGSWSAIGGGGSGGSGGGNTIVAGEGLTDVTVGTTQTLNVNGGEAIEVSGDAVNVDLDTDDVTVGLQLKGAGSTAQLQVKTASADQLGSVRIGNGINIDGSGIISADIPAALNYQGNINPTNEGGNSDAIPTGSVGDAWTCSWGTANTSALLDTAPNNWRAAVNGADATTQATLGDLLVIRVNDGSNADDWTLVETGTVNNAASITVGDGQTNAFPPDSPSVGDVWYNTDDGRTYVFILDGGGQNEWVDVSPQGNQILWKKDSASLIEPQTNTDELRINTLASDDTSGGRVVYADAGGTLVANGVGSGLEINSGAIRIKADSTGTGVNLQTVTNAGNTTTNEIVVNGLNIGNGPGTSTINTRVGEDALDSCTTGVSNTAFGSFALAKTTTGSNNAAFGRRALLENVQGADNTAFGNNAMRDNTASNNTGLGSRALFVNTSGNNNVAVGANALATSTTGSNNTAIGSSALDSNTQGANNICIGQNSGVDLTTGNSNTIIGSLAGTAGMGNTMLFGAGTTERFRVDATGRFLFNIQSFTPANISGAFVGNAGNNNQAILALGRGTAVTGGARSLGSVWFTDSKGNIGASIDSATTAGWTDTSRPTNLSFTTCDTSNTVPTERLRITPNGTIQLHNSPGIDFSQIQTNIAGMTSETLDRYEEGDWTPAMTSGTNVFNTTAAVGRYTRIGRVVMASAHIETELTTINSANAQITCALPFNVMSNTAGVTGLRVRNGGASFGEVMHMDGNVRFYASFKGNAIGNAANTLELGFANTGYYPASTTVRIEFDATYQTEP